MKIDSTRAEVPTSHSKHAQPWAGLRRRLVRSSAEFQLRKAEAWAKTAQQGDSQAVCPISQQPLAELAPRDLYFAEDGQVYSREAFAMYARHEATRGVRTLKSPLTRGEMVCASVAYFHPEAHAKMVEATVLCDTLAILPAPGLLVGTVVAFFGGLYGFVGTLTGTHNGGYALAGAALAAVAANTCGSAVLHASLSPSVSKKAGREASPAQDRRASHSEVADELDALADEVVQNIPMVLEAWEAQQRRAGHPA